MKPFDLSAAKRGEPIQTRDGRPVKFIAHVPEVTESHRVVIQCENLVSVRFENGRSFSDRRRDLDLLMAPRKRTVWVNLYKTHEAMTCIWTDTKQLADDVASHDRIGDRAWPLEIEDECMRGEDQLKALGELGESQLGDEPNEQHWLTKELFAEYLELIYYAINDKEDRHTLFDKAYWMKRNGEV